MNHDIKPLYRKMNTRALHHHHNVGSDARYDRHTKTGIKRSMKRGVKRGLDYTPLYKFLLSKVGEDFDKVYQEAGHRLDIPDTIFDMIARNDAEKTDYFLAGENSFFSKLYVDDDNKIQKVKPDLKNEDFYPSCWCCTHTFNGTPLKHKWEDIKNK